MLFYTTNTDGSIKEYSNYKFDENAIETEKNIVVDFTGHYIFEEETSTKDYQEKLQNYNNKLEINRRIIELKQKLSDTDYIANKLAEAISKYIITEDKTLVSQILTKYSEELQQREQWRTEINKLEELEK